jgi:hypothetical protein
MPASDPPSGPVPELLHHVESSVPDLPREERSWGRLPTSLAG